MAPRSGIFHKWCRGCGDFSLSVTSLEVAVTNTMKNAFGDNGILFTNRVTRQI